VPADVANLAEMGQEDRAAEVIDAYAGVVPKAKPGLDQGEAQLGVLSPVEGGGPAPDGSKGVSPHDEVVGGQILLGPRG
jgi:hypothetical protein